MVFSQLSPQEKDAFFGLLDEYFTSRPDLLSNIAKSQAVNSAANSARDAFKNPSTRNAAIDVVRGGLNSSRTNWNAKQEPGHESADEAAHSGPGRVASAAASLMSHPRFGGPPASSNSTGPPKPPPRKLSPNSTADDLNSPPPPAHKPPVQRREPTIGSLTSTRTFGGDVDFSSAKGFFASVRNPPKNSNQPLANLSSPASGTHKKQFPPPPVRRVTSDSSPTSTVSVSTPPPPPRRKEEPAGEWAEVLYDFTGEPGDLDVKESQQVLIVERSSDDWWTAELDGKRGLVPASYVKIL